MIDRLQKRFKELNTNIVFGTKPPRTLIGIFTNTKSKNFNSKQVKVYKINCKGNPQSHEACENATLEKQAVERRNGNNFKKNDRMILTFGVE